MTVLLVLLAVVVLLAFYVNSRPDAFRVSRSRLIHAKHTAIFPEVNNFSRWYHWSPWAKLDPHAKNVLEGPESGRGAMFSWTGNRQVGEGKMTITESSVADRICLHLEFFKPMKGVCETEFTFVPQGAGTLVTWTMTGKNNFVAKLMSLVMNCDKMAGGMFEKGLANLAQQTESPAAAEPEPVAAHH